MTALTKDVISEVVFGEEAIPDANDIANSVSVVFDLRTEVLYLSLWKRFPFPQSKRWNRAMALLHSAINKMIAERRSASEERDDLLGLLLRAKDENGEAMTEHDVHDEVMTMFLTGQEPLGRRILVGDSLVSAAA